MRYVFPQLENVTKTRPHGRRYLPHRLPHKPYSTVPMRRNNRLLQRYERDNAAYMQRDRAAVLHAVAMSCPSVLPTRNSKTISLSHTVPDFKSPRKVSLVRAGIILTVCTEKTPMDFLAAYEEVDGERFRLEKPKPIGQRPIFMVFQMHEIWRMSND